MRARVTESYPGKAEGRGGWGARQEESGAGGQTGRSWERRGETERAVNSEDGKDGWRRREQEGKEREKQEKPILKHFKPE